MMLTSKRLFVVLAAILVAMPVIAGINLAVEKAPDIEKKVQERKQALNNT